MKTTWNTLSANPGHTLYCIKTAHTHTNKTHSAAEQRWPLAGGEEQRESRCSGSEKKKSMVNSVSTPTKTTLSFLLHSQEIRTRREDDDWEIVATGKRNNKSKTELKRILFQVKKDFLNQKHSVWWKWVCSLLVIKLFRITGWPWERLCHCKFSLCVSCFTFSSPSVPFLRGQNKEVEQPVPASRLFCLHSRHCFLYCLVQNQHDALLCVCEQLLIWDNALSAAVVLPERMFLLCCQTQRSKKHSDLSFK